MGMALLRNASSGNRESRGGFAHYRDAGKQKALTLEGFHSHYRFQTLLLHLIRIFQSLLYFPNYIVTLQLQKSTAEILRGEVPVHDVPEGFDELRTRIAIVDVVRVLPDVA